MSTPSPLVLLVAGCAGASAAPDAPPPPADPAAFDVVEATIAGIHQAMRDGRVTARALVDAYLDRIERYDRRGPALNAIVVVNPRARAVADSLDALWRAGRVAGPLHGTPVIVKDNYDTHDLPTTAGSAVLAGSVPPDDAFQVRRLRDAGAIVLAKSNMAEWAFSPYETAGSALPGYTFNPYALNRVPAGSSGGTAAAVAASFGAVGWARTPGTRSAGLRRIPRWWGSARRRGSPAATASSRCTWTATSAAPWRGRWRTPRACWT